MRRNGILQAVVAACVALAAGSSCVDVASPPEDSPAEFVTLRRAWAPGERQATIDAIVQNGGFGPYSDQAPVIYADTDSVTVVVANPDFSVRAAGPGDLLVLAPRFATSWNISGVDVRMVDDTQSPPDTTDWVGVFWSNPGEASWRGFVLAASAVATVPRTQVNTTAFDASGGQAGAGGGELRFNDGTYWEGNGPGAGANNTVEITAASYGGAGTVTTGPFTGGTSASGRMNGRLRRVQMTRVSGPTGPASFQVDFDFRGTAIGSLQLTCIFPSPCTTNALRAVASASFGASPR